MPRPTTSRGPLLVGVDANGHSDHAVVMAFTLARALDSRVELLHAGDIAPELWSHLDQVGIAAARDATLARLAKSVERSGGSKPDALEIVPGTPSFALVEHAERTSARAIFLGRHERHGGLDFGNTVRAVLSKSPCPVWVQNGAPRAIRHLLCAIELTSSNDALLALAREYARALGAEVTTLHVFVRPELGFVLGYPVSFPTSVVETARDTEQREFKRLLEPVDWQGVVHRRKFVDGDPATEILEAAKEADLIVMGTHGRSMLSRALVGSVAANVLRGAKVPVLVLPGTG
jgi:nucleotide-binding universal stress UspA family protein